MSRQTRENNVTVTYRFTLEELQLAASHHWRQGLHRRVTTLWMTLWPLAMVLVLAYPYELPWFFAGLVGGMLPILGIVRRGATRMRFLHGKDADEALTLEIGEAGIVKRSSRSLESFDWSALTKLIVTPAGFIIHGPDVHRELSTGIERLQIWLPYHAFASLEDRERVGALARSRLPTVEVSGLAVREIAGPPVSSPPCLE